MNCIIDIGDGVKSVGVFYAPGGIKVVKAMIEHRYDPLTMWFLLGCARSTYKTVLVVYLQSASGSFHDMRYTVTEEFAQATIKHITKQVFDHQTYVSKILDCDDLNDAFWHECAADADDVAKHEATHDFIKNNKNDLEADKTAADTSDKANTAANTAASSNDVDDYSDMPPLVSP